MKKIKKNMSSFDRIARLIIVIIIGALYYAGLFSGVITIVALSTALLLLLTSLTGFCPFYKSVNFNSGDSDS